MKTPVETYLHEMATIRSSGAAVKETSYYPVLANLLNEVGKQLDSRVTCIMSLANQGAGMPDGGLFTAEQLSGKSQSPLPGQVPSRGVIEVKGTGDDAWLTADSAQVSRYWSKYRKVLVTNYRDFLLLGEDSNGQPIKLESFRLAVDEPSFWAATTNPRATAERVGQRLIDYLKRAMLQNAKLASPENVAWFLASYARESLARIEDKNLPVLDEVRKELENSLGLRFEGERGDHFFRSTLVQTLFYGVFSAWILWNRSGTVSKYSRFDWKSTSWILQVPMVRGLFEQIATPSKLGQLNLVEILDWAGDVLNRVDRNSFFQRFEEQHAVQYFYEPFLEAFDPELRKELGVWYTPPEIVEYMVERADAVLKSELGIRDGLADPRVYILDPACGTGSYLVATLRLISNTLRKRKTADALVSSDLRKAATTKVMGFEILPAPFIISHLQVGLLLQSLGVKLAAEKGERVAVYLTNSLTGWEPSAEQQEKFIFPELDYERKAADRVKQEKPILVMLGNPPYNGFAGTSPAEEQGLVEPYKEGLIEKWGIKKFNLDDLYIRFFRLAERQIAERTGKGVICYISNFSFLGDPSFVVLRKKFLEEFDRMWFDNMNGSSRETGKRTPDGKPDPSVFSTKQNTEGIRVGTVVSLLVRKEKHKSASEIHYRNFWGVNKNRELLESLRNRDLASTYEVVQPTEYTRHSFRPAKVSPRYYAWPTIIQLARAPPLNGPVERRGNSFIKFEYDKEKLNLLSIYLDPKKNDDELRVVAPRFMISSGEFDATAARKTILKRGVKFDSKRIEPYHFKPMDVRWAYLDADLQPLFSRPGPDLLKTSRIPENSYFITRDTADKSPEGPPAYFSTTICDYDSISGHARHFPILISSAQESGSQTKLTEEAEEVVLPNLSQSILKYLDKIGIATKSRDSMSLIWWHALAICFSSSFLDENAEGIREGWPHIPIPLKKSDLLASADLGKEVAGLLDMTQSVQGVSSTLPRSDLSKIAVISKVGGGNLDSTKGELEVRAGWGHGNDVVMPGRGKFIQRSFTKEEEEALSGKLSGVRKNELIERVGPVTYDVYLNDIAFWRNVPEGVWNYIIGGYQVFKKWLSYQEYEVLGRSITADEARQGSNICRRITALLLLQKNLDDSYEKIKKSSVSLP